MQQERSSMNDVLKWIAQHEPVLSYGNLSVAGKYTCLTTDIHLVSEYGRRPLCSATNRTLTVPQTHKIW